MPLAPPIARHSKRRLTSPPLSERFCSRDPPPPRPGKRDGFKRRARGAPPLTPLTPLTLLTPLNPLKSLSCIRTPPPVSSTSDTR